MTGQPRARPVALAVLVVLSVLGGSVAFAGSASAEATNLTIVSDQPVKGSGNLTVRVTTSTGANVSFKVTDSAGTVSGTATVTDGGAADLAPKDGVVEARLDLGDLFASTPESGTGIVYAAEGDGFSIADQTYDTKRQVAIDADPPRVSVLEGTTAKQGQTARIDYTITDVPQKVQSATMRFVAPDGTVVLTVDGLQAGTGKTAQITLPSDMPVGTYNITLTAVDEAGHRTTDTLVDGLTVKASWGDARNLRVVTGQPVAGTQNVTVKVNVDSLASFRVRDADGAISAKKVVRDGGPADLAEKAGVVETTLDLADLFNGTPASGTAVVYAAAGDNISIQNGTFDTKRELAVDSDVPTASLQSGDGAKQGKTATVTYTVTDVPQKVSSLKVVIIGPDGLTYVVIDGLQAGTTVTAEFTVPAYAPPGEYDAKLVTVDEVGHRATARLNNSINVTQGDTSDTGETSNGVTASDVTVVSSEPVNGSGEVVVRTAVSNVSVNVTFRLKDATGTVSLAKTVQDGGPEDLAGQYAAVVETSLNISRLFEDPPASGTAVVYAAGGDNLSVANQTYQTKRQFALDADAPTANVTSGDSAPAGETVRVGYTATDVPQKVSSIRLEVVGQNGTVYTTVTDLQAGEGRTVEFVLPSDIPAGEYDLRLVVVDEVGHRSTDTLQDGLVVTDATSG